jgi:hypothetical protein
MTKLKFKVEVYSFEEGSDDPRAIEGGGGDRLHLCGTKIFHSSWLLARYKAVMANRYCDDFRYVVKQIKA